MAANISGSVSEDGLLNDTGQSSVHEMWTSQTESEIFDQMKDQYGLLPRDTFKEKVGKKFHVTDLITFRRCLYELSMDKISGTPKGQLIVRKDTTHSGGCGASDKLADDIYVLMQYLQGDQNMDITKMFTEKSKKKITRRETLVSLPDDNITSMVNSDKDMTLREFCSCLLVEMRKDRDEFVNHLSEMKAESNKISDISMEMNNMREDIHAMKNRILKIENFKVEQWNYTQKIEDVTKDQINSLRKMYADINERINRIDLNLSKSQNIIDVPPNSVLNLQEQVNVIEAKLGSLTTCPAGNDVEPIKLHDKTIRKSTWSQHVQDTPPQQVLDETGSSHDERSGPTVNLASRQTIRVNADSDQTLIKQRVDVIQHSSLPPQSSSTKPALEGFVPVERRHKKTVFYVGGILIKQNTNTTIELLSDFVKDKNVIPRSIWKINETGNTMSVKLVVNEKDKDIVSDTGFWPDGVYCRGWIFKPDL